MCAMRHTYESLPPSKWALITHQPHLLLLASLYRSEWSRGWRQLWMEDRGFRLRLSELICFYWPKGRRAEEVCWGERKRSRGRGRDQCFLSSLGRCKIFSSHCIYLSRPCSSPRAPEKIPYVHFVWFSGGEKTICVSLLWVLDFRGLRILKKW